MTFVAPLTDARTLHVWREARRSLLAGLALLTVVAILFKTFLSQLPPFTVNGALAPSASGVVPEADGAC